MRPFVLFVAFICLFLHCPSLLHSQNASSKESVTAEFKVLTEVFTNQSASPVSNNETIFSNGLVFDLRFGSNLDKPVEVSIYQPRERSFVLLDYNKRHRVELDNLQLIRIVEGMKSELKAHDQLKRVFMDDFVEKNDVELRQTSIQNDFINYSAVGIRPKNDLTLTAYLQFLDQFTLIGATNPYATPPFPRIRLNREIKKIGFLPTRIDLKMQPNQFRPAGLDAYSTHRLISNLTDSDQQKIADVKRNWIAFKLVELADYRGLGKVAGSTTDHQAAQR